MSDAVYHEPGIAASNDPTNPATEPVDRDRRVDPYKAMATPMGKQGIDEWLVADTDEAREAIELTHGIRPIYLPGFIVFVGEEGGSTGQVADARIEVSPGTSPLTGEALRVWREQMTREVVRMRDPYTGARITGWREMERKIAEWDQRDAAAVIEKIKTNSPQSNAA